MINVPDVSKCSSLAEATGIILLSQEGVHEQGGNNMGPEVNEYLSYGVGLNPGYAWCCAFVAWGIKHAAQQLNITPQIKLHASVYAFWTDNQNLIIPTFEPNCLVLKNEGLNSAGHRVGHLMFGIGLDPDSSMSVISGNTNAAGSREGNCVAIQARNQSELSLGYGFIKII
jgi:hypothetical protein